MTPPPRILISAPTGIGKTEIIGRRLPDIIAEDKKNGRPHRAVVLVPTHRLGKMIAERYAAV